MPYKNRTKRKKQTPKAEPYSEVLPLDVRGEDQALQPKTENPNPKPERNGTRGKVDASQGHRPEDRKAARLALSFQIVLVLTTIVYTFFSYHQWQSMRSELQETRLTREIENRAYLNVKYPKMNKELTTGEQPIATVVIFNTGNTPAQNVTMTTLIEGVDASKPEPDPRKIVPPANPRSVGVIQREVDISTEVSSSTVLTDELIHRVNQGQLRLYVWGLVKYEDMFGKPHRAGFCAVLKPGTTTFDMCSGGNFAD